MTAAVHYNYEVRPWGNGKFSARQSLNGSLLKARVCDTREEAEDQCRAWEAARP